MEKVKIIVVDDEEEMLVSYQKMLSRAGFKVITTIKPETALLLLHEHDDVSLIITDLNMPELNGMAFLELLKEKYPHLPVIMVTGYGTLELGIEAVKKGAFDFIEKPFTSKKLLESINTALKQILPEGEDEQKGFGFENVIGRSKAMEDIFEVIKKISHGDANILITGDSGVGKELIARSVHKNSLRRNHPLIPINCGALPDQLFESELFGYEKGAFTGAFQTKPGLVELANGGTLFLDEVCELPSMLQVKMLRMLEDRKIRRVGGQKEISINVRIVSATNRDMNYALAEGLIREDFYYRINTIQIKVPPLSERPDDIPVLTDYFLKNLNQKYFRNITGLDSKALEIVKKYHWPGNVRELQNVLERTYYLANPPLILPKDLPGYLQNAAQKDYSDNWENMSFKRAKELVVEEFERKYVLLQLKKNHWNISKTAGLCGLDRRTIHRLVKKYNLRS